MRGKQKECENNVKNKSIMEKEHSLQNKKLMNKNSCKKKKEREE